MLSCISYSIGLLTGSDTPTRLGPTKGITKEDTHVVHQYLIDYTECAGLSNQTGVRATASGMHALSGRRENSFVPKSRGSLPTA